MSTANEMLKSFLKENKDHHYNYEDEIDYKVSSGSLNVDFELGGGFGPGLHRFVGMNEGGKTSEALEVMKNFLNLAHVFLYLVLLERCLIIHIMY